ncbi:MAG TPA: FAD-dependent oxidoreductase [Clostridiaceae bacterium]|nr:FAD-dependent oxidoreductase [Clostridiaceae bacterium]
MQNIKEYQLIIVGGGPAGLAAAISAAKSGLSEILIIERDKYLGGILNQCIHNGFGLHYFKEELTGPEYSKRFIDLLSENKIEVALDTMALNLENTEDWRYVHVMSSSDGYRVLRSKALILAMGCRERTRMNIQIPGTRAAGIFNAGQAQLYVNLEGYMVGKKVIILGSGDVGLIMARRMTLEGAEVVACVEVMPYPGGLNRNIVQCLQDFNIPLYLSHTITDIKGRNRVEQVTVQEVDQFGKPVAGTEIYYDVDTVLLSVGLIPENELSREAGVEIDPRTSGPMVYENKETRSKGVFACGNVLHVHDLVDFVTEEGESAGHAAACFVQDGGCVTEDANIISIKTDSNIGYTVPQQIRVDDVEKAVRVFFRVRKIFKEPSRIVFRDQSNAEIASFKRPFMFPAEMENVNLPRQLLDKISGTELTVSVEE